MRIEDLYTIKDNTDESISVNKQVMFKDFHINRAMVVDHEGYWSTTIANDNELNEMILNGKVITQIYDSNGNEIGSGEDIITTITNDGIVIKCASPFSQELTLRIFGMMSEEPISTDMKFQKFFIMPDNITVDDDNLGWHFEIEQEDLNEIVLSNGSISVMIYNQNGVDITTSPLISAEITTNNVTIKSIANMTPNEVYSIIVRQN